MSDGGRIYFRTFGTFRVFGPDGADLTPRSLKACGLLALLLDAPDHTRARVMLQDKLWSDRGPEQGAASLRQTLTEIRQALGPVRDVLVSDRRSVCLAPDRFRSDWTDPADRTRAQNEGRVFLEDLDIRDAEFEDWLRDRRQAEAPPPAHPVSPVPLSARPGSVVLPFRATPQLILAGSSTAKDAALGKYVLQGIAHGVADRGTVAVHWAEAGAPAPGNDLQYKLEFDELSMGDSRMLRLQMVESTSGQIAWQVTESFEPGNIPGLPRLIAETVDRTVDSLAASGPLGSGAAARDPLFFALQQMFRTRGLDFEGLKADFRRCYERDPRGIYLAWEAFLTCYIIGERRVVNLDALKDEARDLVRRAVELESHNAVVAALAAHVYSFVLGEFAVAHELAERSVRLDQNNVLGWTFLGGVKLFCGQVSEGYECILTARRISGEGPHRHMVDFFASMAAMLSGDLGRGIALGETVNALAPDFAPALRYLLAGYLHSEDYVRAEHALERLVRLEPDFELRHFAEPEYPVPTLRRAGLLDLRNLPDLSPGTGKGLMRP